MKLSSNFPRAGKIRFCSSEIPVSWPVHDVECFDGGDKVSAKCILIIPDSARIRDDEEVFDAGTKPISFKFRILDWNYASGAKPTSIYDNFLLYEWNLN